MALVLVIDDDVNFAEIVALFLAGEGHESMVARDGREGLRLIHAQHPDIVLTDILMPDTDGIEVILANRKTPAPAKLIAMTGAVASGDQDYLKFARDLGADAVLQKPFDLSELGETIAACLDLALP
jgi:DNA-binding response OmpR family regulator